MKILFLTSWYPSSRNPNFGIFIREHAHAVRSTGHDVVVMALLVHRSKKLWKKSLSDFKDETGTRNIVIEIESRFRDLIYHAFPLHYFVIKKTYDRLLRKHFNPDFIHSNVVFPAGIVGYFLSKKLRKKHIITEHWTKIEDFSKQLAFSCWGAKAYRNAARILPVSGFLQQTISTSFDIPADDKKFSIIGNVVPPEFFTYKAKQPQEGKLRLCAIATWSRMKKGAAKQPELLIEAISEFQKRKRAVSVELTMIGGGDKINELESLAAQKEVKAIFKGFLPKKDIAQQLQESDFFVHATLIETFGVVVAEALLTGTPVICSKVGALPELIHDNNGILCENTVESWVNAFERALMTQFNHRRIAEELQNRFDKSSIGEKIAAVYQSCK